MSLEERFWEKVDKGGPSDCWIWTAGVGGDGYGRIGGEEKVRSSHRVAYELGTGQHPGDDCVLHHCDTPLCVNPDHLYLGDRSDNAHDAYERGQQEAAHGEDSRWAKLTWDDVEEIRDRAAQGESHTNIADSFEVSRPTISRVVSGETWNPNGDDIQ